MRTVLVALGCNNACVFCAQGALRESEGPRGDLEASTVAAARSGEPVTFVGGEPTLLPDLPELVRLAREQGAQEIFVQTNGRRLAYASYAQQLRDAGVTGVEISLHGSTAAMHDYHTGVVGSFVQTVTALGVARAAALKVGVSTVITRSNFRHVSEVVRLAHARGVRFLQLTSAQALGRAGADSASVVPAPEMVAPYLEGAVRLAKSLGIHLLVNGNAIGGAMAPFFAGLGVTEPPPAQLQPSPERRGRLPMVQTGSRSRDV